jgi:hypothetical protein
VRTDSGARPAATTTRILDVAERLVQTRGHNGFSYADVASELGITRAALHYHYPGKAELGEALIGALSPSSTPGRATHRPRSRATPSCMPRSSAGSGCACAGCSPPST